MLKKISYREMGLLDKEKDLYPSMEKSIIQILGTFIGELELFFIGMAYSQAYCGFFVF